MTRWWLFLLMAASPKSTGYATDRIVHRELAEEASSFDVSVSLGKALTLSFPEGLALARPPVLGNEAFYTVSATEEAESLFVTVWAKLPQGVEPLSRGRLAELSKSNLQIFLTTGERITVGLRIHTRGVEQVIFSAPYASKESPLLRRALAEQASRLQAAHQVELEATKKEVKESLMLELGSSFMAGTPNCTETFDRSMDRFLIVTAETICRVGHYIVATFTMHNRAREDVFQVEKIDVLADNHEDTAPNVEALVAYEGKKEPLLRFGEEQRASVVFEAKEAWETARRYHIQVKEAGGKKRLVTVDAEF